MAYKNKKFRLMGTIKYNGGSFDEKKKHRSLAGKRRKCCQCLYAKNSFIFFKINI